MGDQPARTLRLDRSGSWRPVTLRIELPLLIMAFGEFTTAYQVVAWLSWVPNALWAEWYIRRTRHLALPVVERRVA